MAVPLQIKSSICRSTASQPGATWLPKGEFKIPERKLPKKGDGEEFGQ